MGVTPNVKFTALETVENVAAKVKYTTPIATDIYGFLRSILFRDMNSKMGGNTTKLLEVTHQLLVSRTGFYNEGTDTYSDPTLLLKDGIFVWITHKKHRQMKMMVENEDQGEQYVITHISDEVEDGNTVIMYLKPVRRKV